MEPFQRNNNVLHRKGYTSAQNQYHPMSQKSDPLVLLLLKYTYFPNVIYVPLTCCSGSVGQLWINDTHKLASPADNRAMEVNSFDKVSGGEGNDLHFVQVSKFFEMQGDFFGWNGTSWQSVRHHKAPDVSLCRRT